MSSRPSAGTELGLPIRLTRREEHTKELMNAGAFLTDRGIEAEFDLALDDPATHIVHLAKQPHCDVMVVH